MWYTALKNFTHHDQRGKPYAVAEGEKIDIINRNELRDLAEEGKVAVTMQGARAITTPRAASESLLGKNLRIGVWLETSTGYSGGRLHMYQYCYNLANRGADVFYVSNRMPLWARDYPPHERLHFLIGDELPPADIDVVMTDHKGALGQAALEYKRAFPRSRLVCLNFETSNWVEHYVPAMAKRMRDTHVKGPYLEADLLLGNSCLSIEYLREWLDGYEPTVGYDTMFPAVNTYAIEAMEAGESDLELPDRPYAVWSARRTAHKCMDVAVSSIWDLDIPFDLACIGNPIGTPVEAELHKGHLYRKISDADKYLLYKNAHMVLAPSLFEGFGMVPGEALAVGTPPVVYDLPVLREVYGDDPIYVPWGDHEAYAEKVQELATAEKKTDRLAQRHVWQSYGMSAQADKIETIAFHTVSKPRADACMIAYRTPTAVQAVRSALPHVDKVRIAYGPTSEWQDAAGAPEEADEALLALRELEAVEGDVELFERDVWDDKLQMRSFLAERITGNRQLVLDADEIWTGLGRYLTEGPLYAAPKWVNLWHGAEHYITDSHHRRHRWGGPVGEGSVCPHYRYSWWRPSFEWHEHYGARTAEGKSLWGYRRNREAATGCPWASIYHLGHALPPLVMKAKHAFYASRDGSDDARRAAWADWDGTEGECGDGIVRPVDWQLPPLVTEALALLEEKGDER